MTSAGTMHVCDEAAIDLFSIKMRNVRSRFPPAHDLARNGGQSIGGVAPKRCIIDFAAPDADL